MAVEALRDITKAGTSAFAAGGSAQVYSATINVPAGTAKRYQTNIADANVSAGSKLIVNFGGTVDTAANDLDELGDMDVFATPYSGGLTVLLKSKGVFSGPVPINYMIG